MNNKLSHTAKKILRRLIAYAPIEERGSDTHNRLKAWLDKDEAPNDAQQEYIREMLLKHDTKRMYLDDAQLKRLKQGLSGMPNHYVQGLLTRATAKKSLSWKQLDELLAIIENGGASNYEVHKLTTKN